jgi:hypothetical protein
MASLRIFLHCVEAAQVGSASPINRRPVHRRPVRVARAGIEPHALTYPYPCNELLRCQPL